MIYKIYFFYFFSFPDMDIQNITTHLLGTASAIEVIFNFIHNDGGCGGVLTTLCQRAIPIWY